MVTVRTKQELEVALKNKATSIRIEGPYAKEFANTIRSRKRKAKSAKKIAMGGRGFSLDRWYSCRSIYWWSFFSRKCCGGNSNGTYCRYNNHKYSRIGNDSWFCGLCNQQEI